MTPNDFQKNYSTDLRKFFETPLGKEFITQLNALRPAYEFPIHEHLMLANRESIRGYEMCLRNIVALMLPPKDNVQPKANYGVEDTTQTKE